jgi:hypothetical protein
MPFSQTECERVLSKMSPNEEVYFLAHLGHWLTIVARGAYEFQAPGVNDPIALRSFNEIHHRVYAQIRSLASTGQRNFDSESLASWLTGEGKPDDFHASCLWAFEQAFAYVSKSPFMQMGK